MLYRLCVEYYTEVTTFLVLNWDATVNGNVYFLLELPDLQLVTIKKKKKIMYVKVKNNRIKQTNKQKK